jgi:hypothetical protein
VAASAPVLRRGNRRAQSNTHNSDRPDLSSLPPPPVPADLDLSRMPFMRLYGERVFQSEAMLTLTKSERWDALHLQWIAWHSVPASSLPNSTHFAPLLGQSSRKYRFVKLQQRIMRAWILCSDNRWYLPELAQIALEVEAARDKNRSKSKRSYDKKHGIQNESDGQTGPDDADDGMYLTVRDVPVSLNGHERQTNLTAHSIIDSLSKEERTVGADAPTGAGAPVRQPKKQLFSEGPVLLGNLTGQPPRVARKQVGLFLKTANDDCARVYQALLDATEAQPIDPFAWIMGRLKPKRPSQSNPFFDNGVAELQVLEEKPRLQIVGGDSHGD